MSLELQSVRQTSVVVWKLNCKVVLFPPRFAVSTRHNSRNYLLCNLVAAEVWRSFTQSLSGTPKTHPGPQWGPS